MSLPALLVALLVFALIVSSRVRAVFFHPRVFRFLFIVAFVVFLVLIGGVGYTAWKYWWPLYMQTPVVEWEDTTLEHEKNPVTPGAGGPKKPTVIQVR